MRQLADLILDQSNVRRIHRDITADTAHGDPHQRPLQRRRIVDAVAHHAYRPAAVLQLVYDRELILREALGPHGPDSNRPGDPLRRTPPVPGDEHRLHAAFFQRRHHVRRLRAHGISKCRKAGKGAVHRQVDDRAAPGHILLCRCGCLSGNARPLTLQQGLIPGSHPMALHPGSDALSGPHGELLRLGRRTPGLLPVTGYQRLAQRMLRAGLCTCGQPIEFFSGKAG